RGRISTPPTAMGRRTNLRLAQSKPPLGQGFRGFDRQRQSLGLHRLRAAARQATVLPIAQPIRLRFGHSGLRTTGRRRGSRTDTTSSARSLRLSVTLKKNRRALAVALTVDTVAPIEASHS